jgi:hypothetical protein
LPRQLATHKISSQPYYDGAEIVEVTGIADMSENLKRVEFKWRLRPSTQNPRPQSADASMIFRKYDDGWRPEGSARQ